MVESSVSEQRIQEIWFRYYDAWSSKGSDRIPFKLSISTNIEYKPTYPEYYAKDDFLNYQLALIALKSLLQTLEESLELLSKVQIHSDLFPVDISIGNPHMDA